MYGLNDKGELWAWGSNRYGQLGLGDTIDRHEPVKVGNQTNWCSLESRGNCVYAINDKGELWAWGSNSDGQLGDGTTTQRNSPVRIGTKSNWVSVKSGGVSVYAMNTLGELWSWGYNYYGQLGDGTKIDKRSPIKVGNKSNWVNCWPAGNYCIAMNSLGELWAWGDNFCGQLGDGTTTQRTSPVRIGTKTNWQTVTASQFNILAINTAGELYGWGYNYYGQLGIGTNGNNAYKTAPTRIGNETNWVDVLSAGDSSYAINEKGELWAWGENLHGELGDGTQFDRSSPVRIGKSQTWARLLTLRTQTLFAMNDKGDVYGWGYNNYGQLGIGSADLHILEPVLIGFHVESPNSNTDYVISTPSRSTVFIEEQYTFTITPATGFALSRVELTSPNGKLNYAGFDVETNSMIIKITNVTGEILATDFTISVSKV